VVDESNNEIVYTLRISGNFFQPKVFREGLYTIKVGRDRPQVPLEGVRSLASNEYRTMELELYR
jgi:hypothetical protein